MPLNLPEGVLMGANEPLTDTQQEIIALGEEITQLLLTKNRRYGDSALNPTRIYSQADPVEQLKIRIDDKLSRIISNQTDEDEDVDIDLIGYLYLLVIAKRRQRQQETT